MKFTTATAVLGAALGVAALPSHHAAHQHAHRSLEARGGHDFVYYAKPQPPAPKETKPAPKEEEKTKSAPKQEKKPAPKLPKEEEPKKKQKPSSGGVKKAFCDGVQYSKVNKRATLDEIHYTGNLGAPSKYGCNLMMVDEDIADDYEYLSTFINDSGKDQECKCWLKIGADGLMTGFFKGGEALDFSLPAGETKYMAADENSQGACACGAGDVPLTKDGQFASTWYEFDMANESNKGWSGADASCIVSAAKGLDIPGLLVEGHGEKSIINPGGSGKNAFLGGTEAMDGLGLNIAPGKVRIDVTVGYSG